MKRKKIVVVLDVELEDNVHDEDALDVIRMELERAFKDVDEVILFNANYEDKNV